MNKSRGWFTVSLQQSTAEATILPTESRKCAEHRTVLRKYIYGYNIITNFVIVQGKLHSSDA